MIDAHIHLDQFSDDAIAEIFAQPDIDGVIAVATDLASAQRLLQLKQRFPKIYCCAGFHPEQPLPPEAELNQLFEWIAKNRHELTACGEVGLPHYLKRENPNLDYQPYIDLLERFIALCKRYDLPINLHIVYDDALIALDLLEKYQLKKAHFHWFKASDEVLQKVLETTYLVSLTPDILWNEKTQKVAKMFPLERLFIETDAPWQHLGFQTQAISEQLHAVLDKIAWLKGCSLARVRKQIAENIERFYLSNSK